MFVEPATYRKVHFDPFVFEPCVQSDWKPSDVDTLLAVGRLTIERAGLMGFLKRVLSRPGPSGEGPPDRAVRAIVEAVSKRERVVIPSDVPIRGLAQRAWSELPPGIRRRTSVATWAFDNANGFDLVAMPRSRAEGHYPENLGEPWMLAGTDAHCSTI